jgi:chloramphenicol O-acetyltransferase type A
MKRINLDTWPRKDHYNFFQNFDYPHFSLCAEMDLSVLLPEIKAKKLSFTAVMMYLIAMVANQIPEFKQRIHQDGPIEHDLVHPSATVLSTDDLFTFCSVIFNENFESFYQDAVAEIELAKSKPSLEEKIKDDSMLFMTSIPWVSFTSFMHPLKLNPADSIPRFAWGKFRQENEKVLMPLSVQGHHALMDGLHLGRFYQALQGYLEKPDFI